MRKAYNNFRFLIHENKFVEYSDFKTTSREIVTKASIVLYVDRDTHQTKILKNRWGNDGIVTKQLI